MAAAAWTCLLLPLASAVVITLGGTSIPRRTAAYISTATALGAFVAAVGGVVLGAHARSRDIEAADYHSARLAALEETDARA